MPRLCAISRGRNPNCLRGLLTTRLLLAVHDLVEVTLIELARLSLGTNHESVHLEVCLAKGRDGRLRVDPKDVIDRDRVARLGSKLCLLVENADASSHCIDAREGDQKAPLVLVERVEHLFGTRGHEARRMLVDLAVRVPENPDHRLEVIERLVGAGELDQVGAKSANRLHLGAEILEQLLEAIHLKPLALPVGVEKTSVLQLS